MFGKYRCTIINVRKSVCDQPSNDKEEAQTQFSNFLTSQAKPLHSEIVKEMLRNTHVVLLPIGRGMLLRRG